MVSKPDWCIYIGPRENPDACICARIESNKRCGDAGWLHKLTDKRWDIPKHEPHQDEPLPDFTRMQQWFRRDVQKVDIESFASSLGLTSYSLNRLGIGWCGWGWTFPMRDEGGVVRGVRVRKPDGSKLAITGSKDGLFVPDGLEYACGIYICEGPTDTAAMLDMGFEAVGRPSCQGATKTLAALVAKIKPPFVAIVADSDAPGMKGAMMLKKEIAPITWSYIFNPPAKDVRAFLIENGNREDLLSVAKVSDDRARALYSLTRPS